MLHILWKSNNLFYIILLNVNTKLFNRSDSELYWRTLYHMFGVLHHLCLCLFGISLDLKESDVVELDNLYRYQIGFLTGWSIFFQTVFLTLSVVYNVMQWLNVHENRYGARLKGCCDVLFSGAVVPTTLFVSLMFWIIFWIDRELVFPKVYDEVVPWWFNHCVHTNIIIFVLIETILQERRHPRNFKLEFILTVFIGVLYAIAYYTIYFISHQWLYGVFGIMTWWQVCLFQLLIWGSSYFFYFIQFPINRIFHRKSAVDSINVDVDVKDVRIKETKDRIIDENMSKLGEYCS